jgi:peptidoglycan/LPS O-acetylase OafA/YrhL
MGALRLLLALSVVAGHTSAIRWLPLANAVAAVEIFFVISGFYMALILNEKYIGAGSYRIFIANRFTRIYPIYFAVAAVTAILALTLKTEIKLFDPERLAELGAGAKAFIFGSNMTIFGLDSFDFLGIENRALVLAHDGAAYPPPLDHMRLVPQAWSLGPELMFYLMAPLIVRRVRLLWIVGFSSLALRIALWQYGLAGRSWGFEFFPTALVFFVLGALLYHAHRTQLFQRWAPVLAPYAVYATALGLFTYGSLPRALSWTLIIASIPFLFYLTKRNPFDRLVGELSYPVYMIHFSIIFAAQGLAPDFERTALFGGVCALLSIVLGFLIYWQISLPIDRWRDRLTQDALQPTREPARSAPAFEHPSAKTAA